MAVAGVLRAARGLDGRVHRTPLLGSASLGEAFGGRAFLKAELFQRTGSFKPRGVLTKLASLSPDERARGVVTTSAGNLAAALAYGSALHDVDCLVVMWRGATEHKLAVARAYGARVDTEADGPAEALERMAALQRADGRTLVHPWDDPLMICGHGTLGLEIVDSEARGPLGLDADDPNVRAGLLHGRGEARDQARPSDRHDDGVDVASVLEKCRRWRYDGGRRCLGRQRRDRNRLWYPQLR